MTCYTSCTCRMRLVRAQVLHHQAQVQCAIFSNANFTMFCSDSGKSRRKTKRRMMKRCAVNAGNYLDAIRHAVPQKRFCAANFVTKATITRVRTKFCTDEFCTWTACLYGTVQILSKIAMVFTWIRANFLCCTCSPRNSNVYVA